MASRGPIVPFDTSWEAVEPSSRPRPPAQPQFPAGLRILVVDDDIVCLRVIEQMLKLCLYHVTTSNRAGKALEILRHGSREFDLIISDLHMPDMDGFKLLELVGLEMDLPVIMMSADDGRDVVMKGIKHGACDYLLKPVSMEALKNIWQHVVRKKRNNELKELENSGSAEDGDRQKRVLEDNEYTSSNEGNQKSVKRRKDEREEEVEEERDDSSAVKKQRVVWSIELHQEFVDAVDKLGVEKAVPKKILEMMNVPGLTRENVASHLQKYRLYLRRLSAAQKQNRVDTHFSGTPEAYSSITSLDGYSLQPFAASGCSPPQSILTLHPGSRGATNIGMDMPIAGQKVFLNSYVQKASPAIAQPQPVNNKQMSTNGLSAYMEPGQFGMKQRQFVETQGFVPSSLQTSSPFYQGAINGHLNNASVMQIPQQGQHISSSHQLSTGHLVNETVNEYDSREQTISSGILKNVLSRNRAAVNGELSQGNYINTSYGTSPQVFYAANYQNSFINGSVGNSHLLAFSTGASDIKPSSMINGVTSATERSDDAYSMKRVENDFPNYHILFDPPQGQDWKLQNVNLSYESGQQLEPQQNHIDFGPSISTHQDFDAILKGGTGRNTCTLRKEVFSITTEIEPHKVACVAQHNGAVHVENSARLREVVPDSSCQNEFDNLPNDVMNIIGCQQQVFGQDEHDYMLDMFLS